MFHGLMVCLDEAPFLLFKCDVGKVSNMVRKVKAKAGRNSSRKISFERYC